MNRKIDQCGDRKVLSQPEFDNLDHVMHQPLKMLIRNAEHLDEAECRYATECFDPYRFCDL